MVNSLQIIPSVPLIRKSLSYLDAVLGQPVVTEVSSDEVTCQQAPALYSVQSPADSGEENMEVIPTPPVVNETQNQTEPEDSWWQY